MASAPRVTAVGPIYRATPPAGRTGVYIAVYFTLADAEDSPADVLIEIRRNGALTEVGTPGAGDIAEGGEGVVALTARRQGSLHRFLWEAPTDLAADEPLAIRVTPIEPRVPDPLFWPEMRGAAVESSTFTLLSLSQEP